MRGDQSMNEEERRQFGAYLQRIRKEADLSLREAEKQIGLSYSYLFQIEKGVRGAPKQDVLRNMAVAYNVPYEAILAAAHLDDPKKDGDFYDTNELDRAFEWVRKDPRYKFGTHMNGNELTPEAKRYIVEIYQSVTGKKLL